MKSFFAILGMYMLMMGLLPCSDMQEKSRIVKSEFSSSQSSRDSKHSQEACSPTCSCSCCASTSFHMNFAKVPEIQLPAQQKIFAVYTCDPLTEMHSPIWQPPRIS